MILYSIVPPEIVFKNYESGETKYLEAEYKGVRVMVTRLADNSYSIARVLSTCPQLFLSPALQPGNIVNGNNLRIFE